MSAAGNTIATEQLTIDAKRLGPLLGISERTVWTRHAAAELPSPAKFGRRTLWSVPEIREWIAAGMPCREEWKRIKAMAE